ncbi:hypothetical protein K1B52_04870 [Lactobacillus crispatus]|nr:hypothetical protein [Lactobacillus crispatus]
MLMLAFATFIIALLIFMAL